MAATWLSILYVGAKPIFVDCDLETYNIDKNLIERNITNKTKAIIVVHIYGHPCDMKEILKIAKKYKLIVIEDAAESLGAKYFGYKTGTMGDLGCFSFYGNKIVTTGEGGMVVTNNVKLAEKCQKFKDLYHSNNKRFIHERIGYNYRMSNLQAALGCGELKNINTYIKKKINMAKKYNDLLRGIPGIILPKVKTHVKCVYWMYAIRIDSNLFGINRDELRKELSRYNIETRDFFYPPNMQPVLKRFVQKKNNFPNTERISKSGLYLPSGLAITESQIKYVGKTLNLLFRKNNN